MVPLPRACLLTLVFLPAMGCDPDFDSGLIPDSMEPVAVTVQRDPSMPTALWVSWETEEPGTSWVVYGVDGEASLVTSEQEESTAHRVEILGLPASREVDVQVHTLAGDVEYVGSAQANTGGLPSDLPSFILKTPATLLAAADRFMLVALHDGTSSWLMIIDRQGRPVWYLEGEAEAEFADIELDEESGDFVILQQDWTGDQAALLRVPLEAPAQIERSSVELAHHALAALPEGSVAYLVKDTRGWSLEGEGEETTQVAGDAIWERAADGSQRLIFSTWDWADPQRYEDWEGIYPDELDWTHANSISYRAATDSLLLSIRNAACLLEIDRETGAVLAEYGSHGDDWGFAEGTEPFYYQHDARWTSAGNLLMMSTPRQADGGYGHVSVAIEYALDEQRHQLVQVWRYGDVDPLEARSHGGATRLANGNTVVNWGAPTGAIREVALSGQTAWEVKARHSDGSEASVFGTVTFAGFYPPGP